MTTSRKAASVLGTGTASKTSLTHADRSTRKGFVVSLVATRMISTIVKASVSTTSLVTIWTIELFSTDMPLDLLRFSAKRSPHEGGLS